MGSLPAAPEAVRFGKYSLVARLATGGMAEIFLARLHGAAGFEKLVCIKRILPHLARDKQFVAMFLDEARIAARITHPNVCQVFELGEIEGSYYIAMEYLEGVPLSCFRRHDHDGPVPAPRLVAGIAVQACEGLHHAHQLKASDGRKMDLVHRDVSPQNLFVTIDGIVKVLDFGIAKIQDASVRTTTGAVKGTYAYMAPEQLRGERVDRRIDVFALGIAMWETLTRRHLFKRDTEFLTFQAITGDPIEDVCALRPDVPPALSSVIMTALSRDREERFPTARMLAEAIAAAIQPLSAPAISEELARAFPAQLAEQGELIRVARSGGAFDLDADRGPSVGRGTDLLTTPVSGHRLSQSGRLDTSSDAGVRHGVSQPGFSRPDFARHDTSHDAPATAAGRRPVVRARPWRVPALVLALAVAGAAVVLYAKFVVEDPGRAAAIGSAEPRALPVEASGSAGSAVAIAEPPPMVAPPSDASVPDRAPVGDPRDPPPSAAQPDAAPRNAARPDAPAPDAPGPGKIAASPTKPAPRAPARPTGPPGFVTIDSTPVYAVIYVDGKNYGETPLVNLELSPGRHLVHAVAPSGATRDVRIAIESGKTAPATRIEW